MARVGGKERCVRVVAAATTIRDGRCQTLRLMHHFKDGVIDQAERADLRRLLDQLVSGELSGVSDTGAATTAKGNGVFRHSRPANQT